MAETISRIRHEILPDGTIRIDHHRIDPSKIGEYYIDSGSGWVFVEFAMNGVKVKINLEQGSDRDSIGREFDQILQKARARQSGIPPRPEVIAVNLGGTVIPFTEILQISVSKNDSSDLEVNVRIKLKDSASGLDREFLISKPDSPGEAGRIAKKVLADFEAYKLWETWAEHTRLAANPARRRIELETAPSSFALGDIVIEFSVFSKIP